MAFTYKHGEKPLEGYVIQRGVGRGGFGEVYYALSEGGKEVALKYLRDNPQIELRGVSHCMNLKSPHLVTIYDVRQNADGEHFIVMEFVHGPSLRDLLVAEPNGLGTQKAAFFVSEIAKGLGYLHDRGIIHRDMKPGNIFYEDGYVKIGDYGLSKFISLSRHSGQTASVGTVHYMAPEVGSGNYHRGIDIYALGVMLYEMLLGKVPFEGSSMGEVLMKHLTEQPEVQSLPAPFADVIRKALQKDPKDRYQTVDEMAQDILGAEQVRKSIADFEPGSLTHIARQVMETQVMDSPHPSPHPKAGAGIAGAQPRRRDDVLDARAFSERIAHRMARAAGGYAPHAGPGAPESPAPGSGAVQLGVPAKAGGRFQSLLVSLIVALGLSVGIAILTGAERTLPEHVFLSFGFIMALRVGIAVAGKVFQRMTAPSQSVWAKKLITLGCCTLPLLVVGQIAGEELGATWRHAWGADPRELMLALLAVSVFVDWSRRVRHGLQGRVEFKDAFRAGLFGMIAGAACGEGEGVVMIMAAGIGAATSLSMQAGALFRRPAFAGAPGGATEPPSGPKPGPAKKRCDEDYFCGVRIGTATAAAADIGDETLRDIDSALGHAGGPFATDSPSGTVAYGRKPRPAFFRLFWGLASAMLLSGAGICGLGIGLVARTDEEVMGFVIGSACSGIMAVFTLLKTTAYKRVGFWNETLRPFLACTLFCGVVACGCVIGFLDLDDEGLFGVLSGLLGTLVTFGLVCAISGRRTPPVTVQARPGRKGHPVITVLVALFGAAAVFGALTAGRSARIRLPAALPNVEVPTKVKVIANDRMRASASVTSEYVPVIGTDDVVYRWHPAGNGRDVEVTVLGKVHHLDGLFLYTLRHSEHVIAEQEIWHQLEFAKDYTHTWHTGRSVRGAELKVEYLGPYRD